MPRDGKTQVSKIGRPGTAIRLETVRLDLLRRHLQIGSQRIGQPVGEVRESDKHIEVDDLFGRKMRLQSIDVGVINVRRLTRQLLGKAERGLLLGSEARVIAGLQRLPIGFRQAYALR